MKLQAELSFTRLMKFLKLSHLTRKLQELSSIFQSSLLTLFTMVSGSLLLREAMSAFVTETQKTVTGDVKLKLYKGNMINAGVTSPYTLYDEEVATFDEDNVYNQADSAGFINLFGLPIKVRAKLEQKRNAKKD